MREAAQLALYGAWQGERFAREEKLKPLRHYAKEATKRQPARSAGRQGAAEMLAAFQDRAQAGAPITIGLVDRPRKCART